MFFRVARVTECDNNVNGECKEEKEYPYVFCDVEAVSRCDEKECTCRFKCVKAFNAEVPIAFDGENAVDGDECNSRNVEVCGNLSVCEQVGYIHNGATGKCCVAKEECCGCDSFFHVVSVFFDDEYVFVVFFHVVLFAGEFFKSFVVAL